MKFDISRPSSSSCFRGGLRRALAAAFAIVLLVAAAPVAAQQRPLLTQDPEPIGAGNVLFEAGFEYGGDLLFPASGLEGTLLKLPVLGITIGVSSIAEIQISGGPYNRLAIGQRYDAPLAAMLDLADDATSTSDVEDIVVGAKVRLLSEAPGRPGMAFRFATRLPNAGNESGLGLDTTDFHASLLFAKTVQSIRAVGNIGLGILGDPTRGDRQNDVLTYGLSVARAIRQNVDVVGELNGRSSLRSGEPPVGTESRAALRTGLRFTHGAGRFDAGLILGFTSRDPSFGVTAGYTYLFKAFDVQ